MLMARVRNDSRNVSGRFMPTFEQRPDDFEAVFVRIGRLACEEHYETGRLQITGWLEELGKERLIALRAEHVRRKEAERRERYLKMSRRDMTALLEEAYRPPIVDTRRVSITLARHAAQHLRIRRYGGFIVSQAPNGDWRVGTKRVSAAQLVDMAKARGFDPSLTGDGG